MKLRLTMVYMQPCPEWLQQPPVRSGGKGSKADISRELGKKQAKDLYRGPCTAHVSGGPRLGCRTAVGRVGRIAQKLGR